MYQTTKDKIYCAKHNLEYTPGNVKKAMELELWFGCEVEFSNLDGHYQKATIHSEDSFKQHIRHPKIDGYKILGKPIGLAEVLMAILRMEEIWGYEFSYYIMPSGEFIKNYTNGDDAEATGIFWNLTKTFDDQSDECKEFIKELIK